MTSTVPKHTTLFQPHQMLGEQSLQGLQYFCEQQLLLQLISSIASKLIYDGGSFKLAPLQGSNLIWSDIFLYASGVLDKSEVTDTYYKLINPSISGCSYNGYEYSCKDGSYSISGTKTVEFTIDLAYLVL